MNTEATKTKHHGRNVKRLREIIGIKQEALAHDLGINQQRMSAIEQKEQLEDDMMERIATILGVSKQAIESFDEEATINIISNTFHDFKDNSVASALNYQCSFHPLDKLLESFKKVEELYEKLLQAEKEKNALLQKLLDK